MLSRYIWLLSWCFTPVSFAIEIAPGAPANLYLGEARYEAYRGDYFTAATRLKALPYPDSTPANTRLDDIDFAAADIELSYRLPERAERILAATFAETAAKNTLAYRLARHYWNNGSPKKALQAINKITGTVPEEIRGDEALLRAQIYIANGQLDDAVSVLQGVQTTDSLAGFALYNLGIALYQGGKTAQGLEQIAKTGQLPSNDEGVSALKDKANLLLGYRLLESGQHQSAKQYLDRISLSGPFSNKALLGSGWVNASLGDYQRALVPWTLLMERNVTDAAVQESFLAVPYAYSKLGLYGKAMQLYDNALQNFDVELATLDKSIKNIRTGKFVQAIASTDSRQEDDWLVKLRQLPDAPETYYLLDLMASREFQMALNNYLDLNDLMQRLTTWRADIESYQQLVSLRQSYYEPLLRDVDGQFERLAVRNALRQERRHNVDGLLQDMQLTPQPDLLATPGERNLKRRVVEILRAFEETHGNDEREEAKQIRLRGKRLIGLIQWQIEAPYQERLAILQARVNDLAHHEQALADIYDAYLMQRRIAAQSYQGYASQLSQLITRVQDAQAKVTTLLARQAHLLEEMVIAELGLRRKRLEEYQVQIIFAQAEIVDLARKKLNAGSRK